MFRSIVLPRAALGTLLAAGLSCLALLPAGARAATVSVTSSPVGPPTPSGFLGISIKYPSLLKFAGTNPKKIDPGFLNLLEDIAPDQQPVLRIGGESTDWSWFPVKGQRKPPGVSYTITPNWMKLATATAEGIHGRLILGLNLEAGNQAVAVGEANAMLNDIGAKNILAMEIGNEPELYNHYAWYHASNGARVLGRTASWSPAAYRTQFSQFADAMPKGFTIAGPASGIGTWLEQLGTFLHDEPKVGLATLHAYPLKHCTASHVVTIANVLESASSYGFVDELEPFVKTAHDAGKPLRVDEMNAITCGGTRGVSDSFATAIWMMNTLFGLDRVGANGINVNIPAGTINAILNPVPEHGEIGFQVQPEYYAMMMFAQAAPPGSQILDLHNDVPSTLSAWGTRTSTGVVHVVLTNKSPTASESTTVRVPGAVGPAAVEQLEAPHGLDSTTDVRLGGQSFGSSTTTGLLGGTAQRQVVAPVNGAYTVKVPAASVEMLTFTPKPGALLMSVLRGPEFLSSLLPSW